ncbi:MAG: phosphotransferase family protein [Candidatus Thorarchaeota archaeon]
MMFEETNPPDINFTIALDAIRKCFPNNPTPRIRFFYHGTYNVYIVEEQYLFRFPSSVLPIKEQQRLVRREAALLKRLSGRFFHSIPVPEFVDANSNPPFMGYKMIPGASLSRHYDSTTREQQRFLGEQVGTFLSQLHAIDGTGLELGKDGTYRPEESRAEYTEVYTRVQDDVFPQLSTQEQQWSDALFHDFLDSEENFEYEPVLIHGDFDTSNILVDPRTFTVTGIIDFEETRVYDPAADFCFLGGGAEFLSSLIGSYKGKIDSRLGNRVVFREGRSPFIYILWGLDHNLDSMVNYGFAALRENIANWHRYIAVARQCFVSYKP